MKAYVWVEWNVIDDDARARYAEAAKPTIAAHGGVVVANGAIAGLIGPAPYANAVFIEFEDRNAAMRWYSSTEYQETVPDRKAGLDARFVIVG